MSRKILIRTCRILILLIILSMFPTFSFAITQYSGPKPFERDYFPGYSSPKVIASFSGLDILTDENVLEFQYPLDAYISRTVMIKNNNSFELMISYDAQIDIPQCDPSLFINHPQPNRLLLEPGESFPIRLNYNMEAANFKGKKPGSSINVLMTLQLTAMIQGERDSHKTSVEIKNTVKFLGEPGKFSDPKPNATIKCKVVNSKGQPIPNIRVKALSGTDEKDSITDKYGKCSIPVYAFQKTGTRRLREIITVAEGSSALASTSQIVRPKPGDSISLDFTMKAPVISKFNYSLEKILDVGYHAYAWDASDNGSVIATAHFHTGVPDEILQKTAYLNVLSSSGKLLFKKQIYGETPAVDVSNDGSLIATTIQNDDPQIASHFGGTPTVFDIKGNVKMSFTLPPIETWYQMSGKSAASSVKISNDNKYLAVGDADGRLFLIDMSSGRKVWESALRGMIRRLWFDGTENQQLFVSSGDGYLRAFDMNGKLLWKTYVDAWLTDMKVSSHYILATSKCARGYIHLIDKKTGNTIWSYPVEERGAGVGISPDEKFVWYGTDIGGGSTIMRSIVFSIDGTPLYSLNGEGQPGMAASFSSDGKYVYTKDWTNIELYSSSGQQQWNKKITTTGDGSALNYLFWVSPDASRIVTAMNTKPDRIYGQIYFYKRN